MKLFTLIACTFLLMVSYSAQAQKNLINNGSFENDLDDWTNGSVAKTTPWDIKAGKASCAIISPNTINWMGIEQVIRIPKNTLGLEFSAWLKTINVIRGESEWMGAVYSIDFLDKADKKIGDGVNIARLTGDNNWEQFKKAVKLPAGAVSFKILIAMGNASGTMLADNVWAKVISADEVAKL